MRALLPLWREWRLFILRWALAEMPPTHPDLPGVVLEINYWEASRA